MKPVELDNIVSQAMRGRVRTRFVRNGSHDERRVEADRKAEEKAKSAREERARQREAEKPVIAAAAARRAAKQARRLAQGGAA